MRHPLRGCHFVPPHQPFRQILTVVAAHLKKSVVGTDDATVGSEENDTDRLDLDRPPQPLLALAQRLLSLFSLRYCLEEHRDPIRGRIDPGGEPGVRDGRDGFEVSGGVLLERPLYLLVGHRADRLREHLPDVPTDELLACLGPELLRFAVDVGEPPLPIQREKGVVYALQDASSLLPLRRCLGVGQTSLLLREPEYREENHQDYPSRGRTTFTIFCIYGGTF